MIHATWHRRYQTGVGRVIYNFAREIIALKNHRGYQCVNLYCPGKVGCLLDRGNRTSFPLFSFFFFKKTAVIHFVLSEKNTGQRSKRMVISSLGCVCFHFAHVGTDKVGLAKNPRTALDSAQAVNPHLSGRPGNLRHRLVTAQTDGGDH